MPMKNTSRYRARASLCRQLAAYDPERRWSLLGQAERWEHLANAEISDHFNDRNGIILPGPDVSDLAA